jgi:AcrR family transcriptional regulator
MVDVAPPDAPLRARAEAYTRAQRRTIEAALELFSRHGVAGTSLQMIADRLGVTKAAVYHQFRTKESIVVAVLDVRLRPIESAVLVAEAAGSTSTARRALLAAIVEVVVADRTAWHTLQADPVLLRVLAEHEPSRALWSRLFGMLVRGDGAGAQVRAAVLSAAIGAVSHPFVADLPDEVLAAELLPVLTALTAGERG